MPRPSSSGARKAERLSGIAKISAVAMPGEVIGRMTVKNRRIGPAPKQAAASSTEAGTWSMEATSERVE